MLYFMLYYAYSFKCSPREGNTNLPVKIIDQFTEIQWFFVRINDIKRDSFILYNIQEESLIGIKILIIFESE
jgi:hypothetical protein